MGFNPEPPTTMTVSSLKNKGNCVSNSAIHAVHCAKAIAKTRRTMRVITAVVVGFVSEDYVKIKSDFQTERCHALYFGSLIS
jgi:hypothetical protein